MKSFSTIQALDNKVLSPSTGATVALDRATEKTSLVTVPSGGTLTFSLANMNDLDTYEVILKYLGTATINWFSGITWIDTGNTAPTPTGTNGAIDMFVFQRIASGSYIGVYTKFNGGL